MLWKTCRSLLLTKDPSLSLEGLNFSVEAITSSPQFEVSLSHLQLALNTDQTTLAFSLFQNYKKK